MLLGCKSRVDQVLKLRFEQEELSQEGVVGVLEALMVLLRVLVLGLHVSTLFLQFLQLRGESIFFLGQILQLLRDVC